MKQLSNLVMLLALVCLSIFISCGKDDDGGGQTDGEIAIEALVESTWAIDAANSSTDASGITISEITIDFSGTSTITFTLSGGGIDTNVSSGGSFQVSETGAISNVVLTESTTELEVASATATLTDNNTTLTLTFSTQESSTGRVGGLGDYTLVFKAS